MDPGSFFVLIVIFFVVVVPATLGIGYSILNRWLRHKERAMELMASQSAQDAAHYAAKVEKLEKRVRVLERLATDRGADLALAIEDLRVDTNDMEKTA